MTGVEERWQERLAEARMEIGRGLEPERLAERYDAETDAEIRELTNQAVKEVIRADRSMVTLDDLDRAEEKLEDAGDYEVVTDGGIRSHYEENGNRDPRGRGDRSHSGGHHGKDLDRECPFCGEETASLPDHLPCNGCSGGSGNQSEEVDRDV